MQCSCKRYTVYLYIPNTFAGALSHHHLWHGAFLFKKWNVIVLQYSISIKIYPNQFHSWAYIYFFAGIERLDLSESSNLPISLRFTSAVSIINLSVWPRDRETGRKNSEQVLLRYWTVVLVTDWVLSLKGWTFTSWRCKLLRDFNILVIFWTDSLRALTIPVKLRGSNAWNGCTTPFIELIDALMDWNVGFKSWVAFMIRWILVFTTRIVALTSRIVALTSRIVSMKVRLVSFTCWPVVRRDCLDTPTRWRARFMSCRTVSFTGWMMVGLVVDLMMINWVVKILLSHCSRGDAFGAQAAMDGTRPRKTTSVNLWKIRRNFQRIYCYTPHNKILFDVTTYVVTQYKSVIILLEEEK